MASDQPADVAAAPGVADHVQDRSGVFSLQVGVVVVAALYFGREVLIPITLAMLLSFILAPVVEILRRIQVPRVPAVLLAVVLALGIIVGFGTVIGTQIASLAGNIPQYAETVEKKIDTVRKYTVGRVADFASKIGRQAPKQDAPAPQQAAGPAQAAPAPQGLRLPRRWSWRRNTCRRCCPRWGRCSSCWSCRSSCCCSRRICETGLSDCSVRPICIARPRR